MHAPQLPDWHRWVGHVDTSLGVAMLAVVVIFVGGYICALINAVRG